MRISSKTLTIIGVSWLILLMLAYLFSNHYLLGRFRDNEMQRAQQNLTRINKALDERTQALNAINVDWAYWDDLYDFVAKPSQNFIKSNLTPNSFMNNNWKALFIFSDDARLVYGQQYDEHYKRLIKPSTILTAQVERLLKHGVSATGVLGLIQGANGPVMIAANQIYTSLGRGPSRGVLINLRSLSPQIMHDMAASTNLSFTITPLKYMTSQQRHTVSQPDNSSVQITRDQQVLGKSYLLDVFGHAIAKVRMEYPALIYQQGKKTVTLYLRVIYCFAIIISLLLWLTIRNLILKRLESLSQQVIEIGKTNDFSRRVSMDGNDELSATAKEINAMLGLLESAYGELENKMLVQGEHLQQTAQELREAKKQYGELESELKHALRHDSLTHLPNRFAFSEIMQHAIAQDAQAPFSAIMIALYNFKQVNDELGYEQGDQIIARIADNFKANAELAKMTLARCGGNSFVLCCKQYIDKAAIKHLIDHIQMILQLPIEVNGKQVLVRACYGVSMYPEDASDSTGLLNKVELAANAAKKAGPGEVVFYQQDLELGQQKRLDIESALHESIEKQLFCLYYQPKIDLVTQKIIGAEALIRWQHPDFSHVTPFEFISVAESCGLIIPLGEWILEQACRDCKAWHQQGLSELHIAINLSALQFKDHQLVAKIEKILQQTECPKQAIELEITETVLMQDWQFTRGRLEALTQLGIEVAIDDFGTGYSSMGYLKQFPFHTMKIDQSFIQGLPHDSNNTAIVEALIALAHNLNLRVVAEGIEQLEQADYLRDIGCDIGQGYYYSRPLANKQFINLARTGL